MSGSLDAPLLFVCDRKHLLEHFKTNGFGLPMTWTLCFKESCVLVAVVKP